jgi:hypothetical protein
VLLKSICFMMLLSDLAMVAPSTKLFHPNAPWPTTRPECATSCRRSVCSALSVLLLDHARLGRGVAGVGHAFDEWPNHPPTAPTTLPPTPFGLMSGWQPSILNKPEDSCQCLECRPRMQTLGGILAGHHVILSRLDTIATRQWPSPFKPARRVPLKCVRAGGLAPSVPRRWGSFPERPRFRCRRSTGKRPAIRSMKAASP